MRFLRSNTAVIVTVGPFYDKTDGVTIEDALTITNERITLTADTDDGSAPTLILDNIAGATSGTANDLNYITNEDAGYMQMELAAANVNRLGRMALSITDAANHVPVFHEFMVVNTALYDAFFASSGGAIPNLAAAGVGGLLTAPTTANTGLSDVTRWNSTAVSTPATAGIPEVNVKNINNVATTSVTTVAAVQGTTVAPTFTSSLMKTDVTNWATAAVAAVNTAGYPLVDVTKANGTNVGTTTSGVLDVNIKNFNNVSAVAVTTVKAVQGLAVDGQITTVTGNVNGSVASVTGNVGGNVTGSVGSIAANGIALASFASDVPRLAIRTNTAAAGGATSITLDAGASAVNDYYNNTLIKIDSGTGAGQSRFISDYVGATQVATVATWVTNPDNTSVFTILPFDAVAGASAPTAAQVATAVWQDATAGDFTAASSIGKALYVSNVVPGAAGGHFIAGTNAATTITTGLTTTFTGSLTGSVASVSGAVGSVTGNVGGNIGGNLEGTLTATERNAISDAMLARALAAESYAADGAVPTMSQMLYALLAVTSEFSISGTTITCKKLDGSTTAMTFTLDSATPPITSRTRAT